MRAGIPRACGARLATSASTQRSLQPRAGQASLVLVLSRRRGEDVVLTLPDGRRVTVTVTDASPGEQVRLGFDAPPDVQIHRGEVQAQIDEQAK